MKFFKIYEKNFKLNTVIGVTILFLLLISSLFVGEYTRAQVETGLKELNGYAWSSNIGWISMNCRDANSCSISDYKVVIDEETGNLSGYAWSSNIGWLQFGGLSGFPTDGVDNGTKQTNARLNGNNIEGWARFLSNGDGWDGWVSLSGTADNGSSYGPTKEYDESLGKDKLTGYTWGYDVVDWISFSHPFGGVTIDDATAQCGSSINGKIVDNKPNNVDSDLCNIGDPTDVSQNDKDTWGWQCVTDELTPSENSLCSASCENGEWICSDSCIPKTQSCGDGNCPSGYTFDPLTGECKPATVPTPGTTPTVYELSLQASPRIINPGQACNMVWDVETSNTDLISCSITSDFSADYEDDRDINLGIGLSGPISGTESFANIDATTEYTLTCLNKATGAELASQTARCSINPNFIEF